MDPDAFLAAFFTALVAANTTPARFAARHPGSAIRAVRALAALPCLTAVMYARGRERATVRRKVRAAERQRIVVRVVPDVDRAELLALANRHERENERPEYRVERPENDDLLRCRLWLAAYDASGRPVALAVTPYAGEWSVLRYFRTLVPGAISSDARYLLAQQLAEALCVRGVRYLVDPARPHWLPNGLRHFQRMLGFRLVRVRRVRIRRA